MTKSIQRPLGSLGGGRGWDDPVDGLNTET